MIRSEMSEEGTATRAGRVRRHRHHSAEDGDGSDQTADSRAAKLQREIMELTVQKEALQKEISILLAASAQSKGKQPETSRDTGQSFVFHLLSQLDVEERASIACKILEQVVTEISQTEEHTRTSGWHGKTLENVQAIRKTLVLQMAEVANREAHDVMQNKSQRQSSQAASFMLSLQGQLSEAVAEQAGRDATWMKSDGHYSSAVADVLELRPFTEAALEMLEEVGIDDASKIRLKDVLRANHDDQEQHLVARKVAMQVCQAKGLLMSHTEERDVRGLTPLLTCAERGVRGEMWLLLQAGADTHKRTKEKGKAAAHIVCARNFVDCLQVLAEKGADLNQGDQTGRSPLHTACAANSVACVQLLADKGADLNHQDKEGRTAAHVCCDRDVPDCLRVLAARGADLNMPDEASETPAHVAAERNAVQSLRVLVESGIHLNQHEKGDGDTCLHVAAYRGHTEAMRVLVRGGASLLVTNKKGNTPLHAAAYWGHPEAVQMLIDAKASPCAVNKKGWTPLDLADSEAHDDCVAILRKYDGWAPPAKELPPPPPPRPKPPADTPAPQAAVSLPPAGKVKSDDPAGSADKSRSPLPGAGSRGKAAAGAGSGESTRSSVSPMPRAGSGGASAEASDEEGTGRDRTEQRERRERRRQLREARRARESSEDT